LVLLILTGLLAWGALVLPLSIRQPIAPLQIGDVAAQDIQAPFDLSFASEILTEQARQDARNKIAPLYLPTDPSIARGQIEKLRLSLNYITTVRFDTFATTEQKILDLSALEGLRLSDEHAEAILLLSDSRWQTIQQESLSVLEQVMRRTIREDQLEESRRGIPTLISFSLPDDQARIVSELVTPFVVANSLFSLELTNQAREEEASKVEAIARTYLTGETIVRRGQIITPLTWEALTAYNLIQPRNQQKDFLAAFSLTGLTTVFIGLYFSRRKATLLESLKGLLLLSITFLIFLYGAKIIIPNRTIIPYLFPIPAFALTLASLYSLEAGLIFPLVLSILASYGLPNSLDLTLYYILTSMVGVLVMGKGRRIANFFWAGIAIGITGIAVILAYRLPDTITDLLGIATLSGASVLNGLASASLTLLFQFLFSQLLSITTSLQLMDLLRPDHPLLQHILRTMPGSYQHSLQVSNLAEQAAEAIGADALLTRAGAIYHDVGKSLNPAFFIENQVGNKIDSHDDIPPEEAAQIIIRHVTDGISLAQKYRLPRRIQDFILEHHGTLLTRYQYNQAILAAGADPSQVDAEKFRYPGPAPQSRETAILMLADGVEARARAELPKEDNELRSLIRSVMDFCQKEGQLDHTNLTLRDLNTITESFVKTLRNTYHPRIRYPEIKSAASPESTTKPTQIPIPDIIHDSTREP
ncbi:MAG: HDIG domain-containing metalloprotein, partial [Chloroflexota bacterium]